MWCAIGVGIALAVTFFAEFLVIVSSPAEAQYGAPSKHDLLRNAGESSLQAIDFFLQTITIVVLAGVLLWQWIRTRNEPAPV